jgi:hypothetical protein
MKEDRMTTLTDLIGERLEITATLVDEWIRNEAKTLPEKGRVAHMRAEDLRKYAVLDEIDCEHGRLDGQVHLLAEDPKFDALRGGQRLRLTATIAFTEDVVQRVFNRETGKRDKHLPFSDPVADVRQCIETRFLLLNPRNLAIVKL